MDRRAQAKYARNDPNSSLAVPEEQRAFKSQYSDPSHPMYNSGLVGFVSGGVLSKQRLQGLGPGDMTPRQGRRQAKDDRRQFKYERRVSTGRDRGQERQMRHNRGCDSRDYERDMHESSYDDNRRTRGRGGGGLIGGLINVAASAAASRGGNNSAPYGSDQAPPAPYDASREYEETYSGRNAGYEYGDPRMARRSSDSRAPDYDQTVGPVSYGRSSASYGERSGRRDKQNGGGIIKRVMKEDVMYLMIVNMPSEAELAEARDILARAKSGR